QWPPRAAARRAGAAALYLLAALRRGLGDAAAAAQADLRAYAPGEDAGPDAPAGAAHRRARAKRLRRSADQAPPRLSRERARPQRLARRRWIHRGPPPDELPGRGGGGPRRPRRGAAQALELARAHP